MLKRYQVLLQEWLEDYIKHIVEKYDLSFSEVIRLELCFSILSSSAYHYPEFKLGITPQEILKSAKKEAQSGMDREKIHRILSKIYFETRKAAEFRLSQEKNQENNNEFS